MTDMVDLGINQNHTQQDIKRLTDRFDKIEDKLDLILKKLR